MTRALLRHALTAMASATLVACAPAVSQLEMFQEARAHGRWEQIADATPNANCQPGLQGCSRLYAIHGEANAHLAFAGRADGAVCPGPGANSRLTRASTDFAKSREMTSGQSDADDQAKIQPLRTQVLYCQAENAASIADGVKLARQAGKEAAAVPGTEGALWQALVSMYLARPGAGDNGQRCLAVQAATSAVARARTQGPNEAQERLLARVQHDADLRKASIGGCGG